MASLFGAIRRLLNIRQGEDEILVVYLERFKNEKNIVKEQLVKHFWIRIESTEEYRTAETKEDQLKIKANGFEAFMTTVFMMNARRPANQEVVERLRTDWTMEMDNYPRHLTRAIELMKHEETKFRQKKQRDRESKKSNRNNDNDQTEDIQIVESSFAQKNRNRQNEGRCYCCGSRDHMLGQCSLRTQAAA